MSETPQAEPPGPVESRFTVGETVAFGMATLATVTGYQGSYLVVNRHDGIEGTGPAGGWILHPAMASKPTIPTVPADPTPASPAGPARRAEATPARVDPTR